MRNITAKQLAKRKANGERYISSSIAPSRKGIKRGGPVKKVNRKRKASEFARCYHSKRRVSWVKGLPSVVSGESPCDNVHVRGDGAGRKAGYEYIIPLTRAEHRELHQIGARSFERKCKVFLLMEAARTMSAWLNAADSPLTQDLIAELAQAGR